MAFHRWQSGLCNEQVKFALGLKRPTITLTSVQNRFERQGKFLNFYKVYEYFRKIFIFLGRILIFHFKNFFVMNFYEVYEYFRKFFLFLSHIDFSFQKIFFMNFYEVYEYFRKISVFFKSYIDSSSLIASRSVHPLKSRGFFVHVRNESTIWTIWIVQKLWLF